MACSSCGQRQEVHQVRKVDGTVRRYATETEARAAASKAPGAEYQKVSR